MNPASLILLFLGPLLLAACGDEGDGRTPPVNAEHSRTAQSDPKLATFGAGCFWCVEAVFEELDGVKEAISGYAGGSAKTANYKAVCSGQTAHAEAVQIGW